MDGIIKNINITALTPLTLQYLLIDGELKGAVLGHWRFRPYDVEDIVLLLPKDECQRREKKVLAVVSYSYKPPHHNILKYCGNKLP